MATDADLLKEQAGRVNAMSGAIAGTFHEIVDALEAHFGRRLTEDEVIDALYSFDWDKEFRDKLTESWRVHGGGIVEAAGRAEMKRLGFEVSFTLDNPYSAPWLSSHGATMVTGITAGTQEALRRELSASFLAQEDVDTRARRLRSIIGLDQRSARAISRYREKLIEDGATDIDAKVQKRAEKARNRRAKLIARTEGISAHAQGTLDSWKVAADEGLIDPKRQRKRWISGAGSDRTCKVCGPNPLGLHGLVVDLDERFHSPRTGRSYARPPAHPACRCVLALTTKKRRTSRRKKSG